MDELAAINALQDEGIECLRLAEVLAGKMRHPGMTRAALRAMRNRQEKLMHNVLVCGVLINHLRTPNRVVH